MHRAILALAISGLAFATPASHADEVSAPPRAAALASVELPPELDRVLRDYERAWRAGDAAALAALFAEDGFVLQSQYAPAQGREAIRAAYSGQGGSPLRLRALAYASGEAIAYIIGAYGYGGRAGDLGKFTLTLRRAADGRWLIHSDMDNTNAPPARPASLP